MRSSAGNLNPKLWVWVWVGFGLFYPSIHLSAGKAVVMWRAWETKEQNLARGVPPEQMGLAAKG